jgi:hypothetical protein
MQALTNLTKEQEQRIDEILSLNKDRNPEFDTEKKSIETLREQKKHDREITMYQGPEQQENQPEHERKR